MKLAALLILCACTIGTAEANQLAPQMDAVAQPANREPKSELKQKALTFFNDYKQKDLASSLGIVDLYAPSAVIYSGVERERGGVIFDKLSREGFKAELVKAASDAHLKELNSKTVYLEPHVKHISFENNEGTLSLDFVALRARSGIKVHWILRENESGLLQIVDEHTISYRIKKSKSASK